MNNLLEFYALIDEKLLYLMTRCRRWRHFLGLPIEFWKSGKSIGVFPVLQGIFLEISTEMRKIIHEPYELHDRIPQGVVDA